MAYLNSAYLSLFGWLTSQLTPPVVASPGIGTTKTPFDARLADGINYMEGRLEAYTNFFGGSYDWGTVCDDDFDNGDATFMCRYMGLGDEGVYIGHEYGPNPNLSIAMAWVDCISSETNWGKCFSTKAICDHSEDVSIRCLPFDRTKVRMAAGPSPSVGRVEVFHNGVWGRVCNSDFDANDALVVCKMHGLYENPTIIANTFGPGEGPWWLDQLDCTGFENNLDQCSGIDWGNHVCTEEKTVALSCAAQNVRLVGGSGDHLGRLEVLYDNEWGTVCDDDFDSNDAAVFCRALGFGGFATVRGSEFGAGSGRIWMDNVACIGTESSHLYCPHRGWGYNNCHHGEDVSIGCGTPVVRLIDDSMRVKHRYGRGRVEIFRYEQWGTVCDDHFTDQSASVVCRMLNFREGVVLHRQFLSGTGIIWLDDVRCTGTELSILDCPHNPWGVNNCEHREDVVIECRLS